MPHTKAIPQSQSHRSLLARRWAALPLVTSLHACSADVVNLGENAEPLAPPAASLCQDTKTLTGDILVKNQDQLDELEGCEEIEGGLTVAPFAGADLRSLRALEEVRGALGFSDDSSNLSGAELAEQEALIESGWLASLEGLESLESVGGLSISGLLAADLDPLHNLKRNTGGLALARNPNLVDLTGLQNMRGTTGLLIHCVNLESLAGLFLPEYLDSALIVGPKLADLGSWNVDYVIDQLVVNATALTNLDAFSSLSRVDGTLQVMNNPLLENMDGLNGLVRAGALVVTRNPRLTRLPEFPALRQLPALTVMSNARLAELSTFEGLYADLDDEVTPGDLHRLSAQRIEIIANPELLRIATPTRWQIGQYVLMEGNARLLEVDFGELASVGLLSIVNNPSLTTVNLGALSTINVLSVLENPSLHSSSFDGVQTFERDMWGNADTP